MYRDLLDKLQNLDAWESRLAEEWKARKRGLLGKLQTAALDDPDEAQRIANQIKGFDEAIESATAALFDLDREQNALKQEVKSAVDTDDGY